MTYKECDRNICLRNEYNGISCDECDVNKTNTEELPPKYNKDDLIYRETARRIIDSNRSKEQMLGMLASIPKVENTAEWEWIQYEPFPDFGNYHCSKCSHIEHRVYGFKYCPNCGSRMKGENQ